MKKNTAQAPLTPAVLHNLLALSTGGAARVRDHETGAGGLAGEGEDGPGDDMYRVDFRVPEDAFGDIGPGDRRVDHRTGVQDSRALILALGWHSRVCGEEAA